MTTIPQGYKSTELGIIPETWSVKELGQILSIHHGKSQKDVEADDGEYPIMATGGLIGRSRSYLYNKPSVLIGRKGTIDKPQFIDTPFWTVDTLFYTSIRPDYDPFFTYSACCCIDWESYNEGTCVPSLISSTIEKIKLPIPSDITEQRAIATALADVDALIEAKRALLEKKRAIKQGTMQELLTGNRRLPGFPVTPMQHTEIGDIPEDWEVKTLGRCASIARGGSPRPIESYLTTSPEGVNWIKIGDVSPGAKYIEDTEEKILSSGAKHSRKVKPGDLLLSNSMSYGRPYILSLEGCIHDGWLTIADYDDDFYRDYLYYALGSSIVVIQYEGLAAGTGVKNLNKKIVAGVQVPCPRDFHEQEAIASALSDMDDELVSLERKIEKLVDLKEGMMQNLLTGRIRLV